MSWVRLDDGFHDHRKTLSVSLAAVGLFALGLAWAARQRTNGKVPKRIARHLAREGDGANNCEHADELVAAGLWHEEGDEYVIHDFLDYNPSAKSLTSKQKAARERMRRLRSGSPSVRANISATCAHVPRGRDGTGTGSVVRSGGSPEGGFDAFWAAYPKKVGKQPAVKAWGKIRPDADLLALMVAALGEQRESDQWRRGIIPNPATWLNEERWNDELTPGGLHPATTKAAERTAASRAAVEAFGLGSRTAAPRDVTPLRAIEGGGS